MVYTANCWVSPFLPSFFLGGGEVGGELDGSRMFGLRQAVSFLQAERRHLFCLLHPCRVHRHILPERCFAMFHVALERYARSFLVEIPSLKLTAKAPTNGWLEYDPFLLGRPIFRCYVSFREGNH